MCSWFIQKREWFSIYMLLYQCFCCINCFSFIVEVKEISGNFSDVFGKNGKNTLYLHTHTHTHTYIYICIYRNKVKQIFKCFRRMDLLQVLQATQKRFLCYISSSLLLVANGSRTKTLKIFDLNQHTKYCLHNTIKFGTFAQMHCFAF